MTFYNPFFPPFFRFPQVKSTFNSSCVDNSHSNKNVNDSSAGNACSNKNVNNSNTRNPRNPCSNNGLILLPEGKKNDCRKPQGFGFFYNLFQDTDSLIIIGLLYFLYNQEVKDFGLMLCLLLLLLDD